MANMKLNLLPVKTFGKKNVNSVEKNIELKSDSEPKFDLPNGVKLEKTAVSTSLTAAGSEFLSLMEKADSFVLSGSSNEPVRIEIEGNISANITINVKDNSSLTVILLAKAESALLHTHVNAGKYAQVKLSTVFCGGDIVSDISAQLDDEAVLDTAELFYGGADAVSGTAAVLKGRKSRFGLDIGYLADNYNKLDISLNMIHEGSKTVSNANISGVLDGQSEKTFKGTIDFKKNAKGAKGSEHEDVMLLSENAVNKTVPLILCEEEDVEGNHGAAIGRIDKNVIFYMQSRGLPIDEIYRIIARSKISRVIDKISDEKTSKRIYESL